MAFGDRLGREQTWHLTGPPLNLPRRQGGATGWAPPKRQVHTSGTRKSYTTRRAAPGAGRLLVLAACHQADGDDLLGAVGDRDVDRCVVDDTAVHVLAPVDLDGWEHSRDGRRGEQG